MGSVVKALIERVRGNLDEVLVQSGLAPELQGRYRDIVGENVATLRT